MNKAMIIGRLGQDPVIAQTKNGTLVANLSVASSKRFKDQNGQQQEKTEWHRMVLFGKLAEIAQKYMKKGDQAYFEGELATREWEKDGIKRYTTEILVKELEMLGSANGQGNSQGDQPGQAQPAQGYQQPQQQPQGYAAPQYQPQQPQHQQQQPPVYDQDIPF